MTGLQSARPASNDDHRIATRGKRFRLNLGGTASLRRLLHRHNQSTQPTQSARPTRSPAREAGGGAPAGGQKGGERGDPFLVPLPPAPPPPPCLAPFLLRMRTGGFPRGGPQLKHTLSPPSGPRP